MNSALLHIMGSFLLARLREDSFMLPSPALLVSYTGVSLTQYIFTVILTSWDMQPLELQQLQQPTSFVSVPCYRGHSCNAHSRHGRCSNVAITPAAAAIIGAAVLVANISALAAAAVATHITASVLPLQLLVLAPCSS